MPKLRWKHDRSASAVRTLLQAELGKANRDDTLAWDGDAFSASVGWGTILKLRGHITEQEIVVDQCSGVAAGRVLSSVRASLTNLFPGGETA